MRNRTLVLAAAGLLAAVAAASRASADNAILNNWHVHDCNIPDYVGEPACGVDASGVDHKAAGFFPTILGVSGGVYVNDPAACPNATDKSLLPSANTSERDVLRAGICMTSTKIIQLRTVPVGTGGPEGWTLRAGPESGYETYYLITSR